MAKQRRSVYPVVDHWLPGIPAAPIIADADIASRLVRTGAFSRESPGEHPDSVELTEDQIAGLAHFDNAVDDGEAEPEPESETPAQTPEPEAKTKAEAKPAE